MRDFIRIVEQNLTGPLLAQLTREVRDAHNPHFRGSCEGAAGDLARLLKRNGIAAQAIEGEIEYPIKMGDEEWPACPHCWVETNDFILDPTVEQFDRYHWIVPKDSEIARRYHARGELADDPEEE